MDRGRKLGGKGWGRDQKESSGGRVEGVRAERTGIDMWGYLWDKLET